MGIKKIITNSACISFLFLLMTGCAKYVDINPGSDEILLVTKKPVGCISKGTVDVTALAEIAYVERSEKNINKDLLQLAKNSAIKVKANTIIKSNSPKPGEATFSMYKCNRPWTDKK
mgnify:CR=1 FL=1|tara:strand:- start:69 stop:419 length:351 start_codon:yes stop_codon:yes gene_type:complete